MGAEVRIKPSGHEFTVEKGETVLEAALRSGISLNYSCNNGTCGECKARVVSGQLAEVLPHDYVLSAVEKREGFELLCCMRTESDLVLEAGEVGRPEDIPVQQVATTVYKIEQPVEDVRVLHLRTPRSSTLRFLAGQYATLHLGSGGSRNKSIASCPCNGRFLQFHIRHVPGDPFAEYVFNELKTRQMVDVEGPYGRFNLDETSRRPIIFLAYETGFAPVKSLIEHAIALDWPRPMRLYWMARHGQDHYLDNYCRAWRDALDDFEYTALTPGSAHAAADMSRYVDMDLTVLSSAEAEMALAGARVVDDFPVLDAVDVYASGPEGILTATRPLLLKHGLPPDRLFVDCVERL